MPAAFYEFTGDPTRFISTRHCASAWSSTLQHGGPPAALLVRTVENLPSSIDGPVQISRFAVDILGPVPIADVTVMASVVRPGRSVELVEARLTAGDRVAMVARAWRMRRVDLALPTCGVIPTPAGVNGFPHELEPLPEIPSTDLRGTYDLPMWNTGYADAVDWRFVVGGVEGGSPAAVWARPRIDLLPEEGVSPMSRLLLLADTGNGLSRVLDIETWWFINTELTVHVHRPPAGEWTLLAARSTVENNGTGLTETELFDVTGRVGRAAQSLMVGPRTGEAR